MTNKSAIRQFYSGMGFSETGEGDFPGYLMLRRDEIEVHFFEHQGLNPQENDGQVYIRVERIADLYQQFRDRGVRIHPQGALEQKPWGQIEFSVLDPDFNLLTFGESRSNSDPQF